MLKYIILNGNLFLPLTITRDKNTNVASGSLKQEYLDVLESIPKQDAPMKIGNNSNAVLFQSKMWVNLVISNNFHPIEVSAADKTKLGTPLKTIISALNLKKAKEVKVNAKKSKKFIKYLNRQKL